MANVYEARAWAGDMKLDAFKEKAWDIWRECALKTGERLLPRTAEFATIRGDSCKLMHYGRIRVSRNP